MHFPNSILRTTIYLEFADGEKRLTWNRNQRWKANILHSLPRFELFALRAQFMVQLEIYDFQILDLN